MKTLSAKIEKLGAMVDRETKDKAKKTVRLCSACAGILDGLLYYCKEEACENFPLCDKCLCQKCGCCPDCEECGVPDLTSDSGNLFCVSCGQVEQFRIVHHLGGEAPLAECNICSNEYSMNTSGANLYLEGVDYEFQRKVNQWESEPSGPEQTEKNEEPLLFCVDCFQNMPHKTKYVSISHGRRTEHFQCLTCQKDRVNRTWRTTDGTYKTSTSNIQPLTTSNLPDQSNDDYGRWGYCTVEHWRDPIKIGKWTVYVSASSDRPTPTQRARLPQKDQPILPDYGLYFSTEGGRYGMGWSAKVQTTPDFPVQELGFVTAYPRLFYDWLDMGAPRSSVVLKLVAWAAAKIREGKKLDLGCFGGHGRTGTFLALLFIEIENITADEAMKAVWTRHCEQAIETYIQRKFIYEFNGERAPSPPPSTYMSNVTTPSGVKKEGGNKFKYLSHKEKKRLKASRRRTRVELKECVTAALAAGVTTRKVLEEDGKLWTCGKCGSIRTNIGTFGSQQDATWAIWCQSCKKMVQHTRPEILFELLEE